MDHILDKKILDIRHLFQAFSNDLKLGKPWKLILCTILLIQNFVNNRVIYCGKPDLLQYDKFLQVIHNDESMICAVNCPRVIMV